MTTHATHAVTFSARCPQDGTHDAEWSSTSDAQPTATCRTCDPPEPPASYRWLRDVDTQRRRA